MEYRGVRQLLSKNELVRKLEVALSKARSMDADMLDVQLYVGAFATAEEVSEVTVLYKDSGQRNSYPATNKSGTALAAPVFIESINYNTREEKPPIVQAIRVTGNADVWVQGPWGQWHPCKGKAVTDEL